jgi:hypothetical protein
MFGDQAEEAYFQSWLQLASTLGGRTFCAQDAYLRVIPHINAGTPAVRYAAIAVGAIRMAIGSSELPRPSVRHDEELSQNQHYQSGLTYYGRALYELSILAPATDDSMREAILCALLFTCKELLEGQLNAAIGHIQRGVTVLDQLLTSHGYDKFINIPLSELPPEEVIIDHEIFRIYRMLDAQSWAYVALHPWPSSLARWKDQHFPLGSGPTDAVR